MNFKFILIIAIATTILYAKMTVIKDTLSPCNFTLLVPEKWSGNLIMYAHGLRPESSPINSTIDTADYFDNKMVNDGWLIASSSYRRNGWIIKDAITDIGMLYDYISKKYGVPKKSYLIGASMGSIIGTIMAEDTKYPYSGYLILCSICCNPDYDSIKMTFSPKKPILLAPNKDELDASHNYILNSSTGIRPYLWVVNREGHCSIIGEEKYEAFLALKSYVEGSPIYDNVKFEIKKVWPKFNDKVTSDTIQCPIIKIYSGGTILVGSSPDNFLKIGVNLRDTLCIAAKDTTVYVPFGTKYSDVKDKEFIAFPEYFNGMRIARNWDNANAILKFKEGDIIKIWKKKDNRAR